MTADEIKALVERLRNAAEKATPGQWNHTRMGVVAAGPIQHFTNGSGQNQIVMTTGSEWMKDGENEANADHIAASNPENVLALLSQVETLQRDIDDLKHDNASMLDSLTKESVARCEAEDKLEIATQELKNIANADTVEWDDPTQYEAWAKSRARHTLAQIDKEKP